MYIFYHFILFLSVIILIKKRKPSFFLPKNGGSKGVSKSSGHFRKPFLNLFFQSVRSWACPWPPLKAATRVATFTAIFFAYKKGYPLPSLTRKTVLIRKFRSIGVFIN
ncbi:hypothetical protein IX38_07885 [Chryseobacterium luteum]|uniref:Uncharacterized protein n=1 Tax=Chryseobacterium luteum TaxID=421531 RepID=A0A085ZUF1_9FLAO|nr:hypothetical protein IX38_07885 [Chryseobacterium luteum]